MAKTQTMRKPSQAQLKKHLIELISKGYIIIESISIQNESAQVPDPSMVVHELTGRSQLTVILLSKKQAKRFNKRMLGQGSNE